MTQMSLDEYRSLLALNKRNKRIGDRSAEEAEKYDQKQAKRLSLLRHHARKAKLQVAKVSGYNIYTLIAKDGLAMTFDNLDACFDFCHKLTAVQKLLLEE